MAAGTGRSTMSLRRLRFEHALYAAAFLLALVLRLAGLGRLPLNDGEAGLALQALSLSQGQQVLIDPHPAYLMLTTAWMSLFEASDWTARFWPALAGSLLALTPLFFRRWLGRLPAVILAFFFVIDPTLLAVSRTAGSTALALFFVVAGLGLLLSRRYILVGIAAGMAVLSGPAAWPGLVGLAAAILAAGKPLQPQPVITPPPDWPVQSGAELHGGRENPAPVLPSDGGSPENVSGETVSRKNPFNDTVSKQLLLPALGTVFLAGTLFFSVPRGLSAMAGSIPAYLAGWGGPVEVPAVLLLYGLLLYGLFPVIFGLWGGVNTGLLHKNPVDRFLFVWWAAALLLALFYPARQTTDLAWPAIPLLALTSRQVVRLLRVSDADRLPSLGQALLAAVILGFIYILILRKVNNPDTVSNLDYLPRLIGSIALLISSTALVAWGWSRVIALRGLSWAFAFLLFLIYLMSGWNAAGFSGHTGRAFWTGEPVMTGAGLLLDTIDDLDQWGPLSADSPDLVVAGIDSPALRWALRDVKNTSYALRLASEARPALVITPNQDDLALSASYRGQEMTLAEGARWEQITPAGWLRWLVYRVWPNESIVREQIILWARVDLFPGGEVSFDLQQDENQVQPVP